MIRYVALLRGINVGGKRKVPMPELRPVFESQGLADVSTYMQSGNVLFKADGRVPTVNLESAIADRFGIDVDVILRTSTDLHRIVTESPLATRDPTLVHVGFMAKARPDESRASHLASYHPRMLAIDRAIERVRHRDQDAAAHHTRVQEAQRDTCRHLAQLLADENRLAGPWTVTTVTDMLWAQVSSEVIGGLLHDCGWSSAMLADHLAAMYEATFIV